MRSDGKEGEDRRDTIDKVLADVGNYEECATSGQSHNYHLLCLQRFTSDEHGGGLLKATNIQKRCHSLTCS